MASGMKDCITVIHRQPSVFGGQVNQLLVRFLPIMIIIIIVVVIVITSAKQVCFCLALLVCLLRWIFTKQLITEICFYFL